MRQTFPAIAFAAAALLLAGGPARATTITFDDLAPGTTLSTQYAGLGATFAPNAFGGAGSSTSGQDWATNTDMTIVSSTGPDVNGLGAPSLVSGNVLGSYDGWLAEDGDGSFTITFASTMSSVSADFAGVATPADVRMFVYDGSTLIGTVAGTAYGQFALSYSAAAITSVVIAPGSYDDWVAVDNISFAPSVPEPAGIALMAAGLGVVALRRRRGDRATR